MVGQSAQAQVPRQGNLRHPETYAELRRDDLTGHERAIFDAYADRHGIVQNRDIDTLLRRIVQLRRLLSDVLSEAGYPAADGRGRSVAAVPTEVLERADIEALHPDRGAPDGDGDDGGADDGEGRAP